MLLLLVCRFDFHCKPNSTKGCERMIDRPAEKSVRVQMINASGPNEARHLAAIARRKKAEKALLAKLTALMGSEAATAASDSSSSSLSPNAQLFHELTSPRSKSRQRMNLLDAEWRYFPEFPPPAAQPLKYYLHCEMGIAGDERRMLRLDAPGEREREYALAVARMHEAEEKRIVAQALKNAATAAASEVAAAASSVASAASSIAATPAAAAASQSKLANARSSLPSISTSSAASSPPPVAPPARSHFSCYTYDPKDPTPSVGGATFDVENSGGLDNRAMESRPDVLVFTSEPLEQPLVVLGFVRCTLYVRSNCATTDFVARLCDVYPLDDWSSSADIKAGSGKSQVLCDGLFKVTPAKIESLTVEKPTPKIMPLTRSSSQGQGPLTPLKLDAGAGAGAAEGSPESSSRGLLSTPASSASSTSTALVPIGTPKTPASLLAGPFFPITAPDESATPLLKLDIDMVCCSADVARLCSCVLNRIALTRFLSLSVLVSLRSGPPATCFKWAIAFASTCAAPLTLVGCGRWAERTRSSVDWISRSCSIRRSIMTNDTRLRSCCRCCRSEPDDLDARCCCCSLLPQLHLVLCAPSSSSPLATCCNPCCCRCAAR